MKKGISLIVMLITIVVIIILAASIVNTVIYNNPMDNAKEATFRSDLQEIKYAYGIRQGELMAKYKGDKSKIKEEDYAGVVHKNYEGEILAFEDGLAYLGQDKKKQEIAESMDYIIGNPNDSVLKARVDGDTFYTDEYIIKITKIKFITNNKVPKGVKESWDVSDKNNGLVMAWVIDDGNGGYELTIGGNGKVIANKISSNMFKDFKAVKEINIQVLDTSKVTNMDFMFFGCISLANIDVSNFNTSKVTNMHDMFGHCVSLTSLDLSNFDTSNVDDMGSMFIDDSKLKNLDISNFNTSKVTTMAYMLRGCAFTNIDVSHFDTSNVESLESLFFNCKNLVSIDVSHFKTSKVGHMGDMLGGCSSLTNINLGSNFDTSNVKNMAGMFAGCSSLTSIDVSNFDTSKVTNMNYMFQNCNKLKTNITIKNVDTTAYSAMFNNAAIDTSAEIKVNYTSETSALVDEMLKTKSSNSNVIKGNQVNI